MKKTVIIFLIIIVLCFSACSKSNTQKINSKTHESTSLSQQEKTTASNGTVSDEDSTIDSSIDKIVFEYWNESEEFKYDESVGFLNDIINCESIPNAEMTDKIGSMKLVYKDGKIENFATVYFGSDYQIYIKYNNSSNPAYAYNAANIK